MCRDFQRSRVYAWEREEVAPRTSRLIDFADAQAFVDGVWLALGLLYPPRVDLMDKRATRVLANGCRAGINIREKTPAWIILHELAHTLTMTQDDYSEGHGPDFMGIYLKLLEKVLNIPLPLLMYSLTQTRIKYNLAAQPRFVG
jgi:hypothetical protein